MGKVPVETTGNTEHPHVVATQDKPEHGHVEFEKNALKPNKWIRINGTLADQLIESLERVWGFPASDPFFISGIVARAGLVTSIRYLLAWLLLSRNSN